jgi:outer membrane protein TolC
VKRALLLLFLSPALLAQEAALTLDRAVALALERNERVAIADTTVAAAEARVRRARSVFLPRVDVSGTLRGDYDNSGTDRTVSAAALLTQPVFDARSFPIYRQIRFEREAARYDAADARRLLGFDAAAAFLSTLSYEQVLLAAQHRRDFAQTNLDDVKARFEAGLVSSNDVTRAELELATAVRGVAQAQGNVEVARVDLETLLKTDIEGPLAVPSALLAAAAEPGAESDASIARAQQQRTDILAQRAGVEALRAYAQEPAARFFPSLTFQAQTRNINDGPVRNRDDESFAGLFLSWAVFDAGVRNAESAERQANVRGAELGLEATLREAEREIRSAGVQLTTEQAALTQATAALRAAQRNADETGALYREGLASALELADANQSLFDAEVAEVTARYRMAIAYLMLREASGDQPVAQSAGAAAAQAVEK